MNKNETFKESTRIAVVIQPYIKQQLSQRGDGYLAFSVDEGTTLAQALRGAADMLEAKTACSNHRFNDSQKVGAKNDHVCGLF